MGRKSKLTPERVKIIIEAILDGNYEETAARMAGITPACYWNWKKRGRDELERVADNPKARVRKTEKKYVDFFDETTRAKAQSEKVLVERWSQGAKRDWRAARDLLARRWPDLRIVVGSRGMVFRRIGDSGRYVPIPPLQRRA